MYDAAGYSLWFCEYKYTEENTASFMTMNKVSGFLQRMDFVRKHAFAKMAILEEKAGGPFHISGVWLFRGTEIPKQVLDESYDMELYEWTKVRAWERRKALLLLFVCGRTSRPLLTVFIGLFMFPAFDHFEDIPFFLLCFCVHRPTE